MQKSFSSFLQQLHQGRKSFKELSLLKLLPIDDFEELKNLDLLKRASDSKRVLCAGCDEPHPTAVHCEGEKLYTICENDSKTNYLASSDIRRWEFDVVEFLQRMTARIGISGQVEKLDLEGLWHLGAVTKDELCTCYFYHGDKLEEVAQFLDRQTDGRGCQIVITSKRCFVKEPQKLGVLTFELGFLVELKGGGLKFKKKVFDQYLSSLRLVQFDLKSGRLSFRGEPIVTISLNTAQYYFAAYLWEKFGEPRANVDIRQYISKRRKQNRGADQMCYDLKSKIKSLAKGDERKQQIIDKIFKPSSAKNNQNGFMMQSPSA